MWSLANDRSILIRKADNGSYVIVWDREHFHGSINIKILQELAEASNDIFKNLKRKGKITEKELKYFIINHKKATNLGKIYLLPKIIRCAGDTSHFLLWYTLRESF